MGNLCIIQASGFLTVWDGVKGLKLLTEGANRPGGSFGFIRI